MRLIDTDKLKKDILLQNILGEPIQKIIDRYIHIVDEQPTAFDVDKVVEQLETRKTRAAALQEKNISEYFEGETDAFEFALKIVKGGGVE